MSEFTLPYFGISKCDGPEVSRLWGLKNFKASIASVFYSRLALLYLPLGLPADIDFCVDAQLSEGESVINEEASSQLLSSSNPSSTICSSFET